MASEGSEKMQVKGAKDLNQLHTDKSKPNARVKTIVEQSHERVELERKHPADADDLSRQENEKRVERMLLKHRQRRRRKSRLTLSDVRQETAKILEEFLQTQMHGQSIQTRPNEHRYQRFVEMDIAEETTQSGESGSNFPSRTTLDREESIPFADDSDLEHQLTNAGSLPNDDMFLMYSKKNKGAEIIHGKSKSVPYKDETVFPPPGRKYTGVRPPPPPPPGTPFSPSDASGSKESLGYVPYTGFSSENGTEASSDMLAWMQSLGHPVSSDPQANVPQASAGSCDKLSSDTSVHSINKLSQPKVPTSLELPSHHSRSGSTTPRSESGSKSSSPTKSLGARRKTVVKSGSISSSESDGDSQSHFKDRKKKPFYKKAQERLQTLLRKQKAHSPDRDGDVFNSKEQISKKKHKKKHKKDNTLDESDCFEVSEHPVKKPGAAVLEDRHIHINSHIHQTHFGGNGNVVHRTEEATEVTDIVSDSEKKHIEKHLRVKESAEGGKGFFGRIKRMTSKDKGKKRMKGSKSAEFQGKNRQGVQYGRGLSMPGHEWQDENDIKLTHVGRDKDSSGHSTVKARQVVDRRNDIKRHSSHLDIVNHDGSLVERVFFDEDANDLPRNKSFDLVEELYVHETDVIENGKVKMIRDVSRHDHMVISNENLDNGAVAGADDMDLSDLTPKEKDEMFGKIAGRLAFIGDNIMLERNDTVSPTSTSSESKTSTRQSPSPDEEIRKAHLSKLEAEIRDELRLVADEMDARLAANARQAAIRIAGVVAYDQFSMVVDEQVNKEVGWAQVAAVFNITKRAIQVAGASGTLAVQIKEMSLKYIEDKFASWIVGQGGWDSMLSGSDTDTDSELD